MKKKINKKKHNFLHKAGGGLLLLLSTTLCALTRFVDKTYDMSFGALIYTLTSPLKGTSEDMVFAVISSCVPLILICMAAFIVLTMIFYQSKFSLSVGPRHHRIDVLKWGRRVLFVLCVLSLPAAYIYCDKTLGIGEWISQQMQRTTIYEEQYVDPDSVAIEAEGEAKNLIYIYLESMETTYASTDVGGYQEVNYIPNLTSLALSEENISFSDNDALGGFSMASGANWTMAALLATTSGIPFRFPVDGNGMGEYENFASGVTALGDILEEKGYTQEFLCGSNANFAGRRDYLEQHGNYEIFDYVTAIEKGYIASDHLVWWGLEDYILYGMAKDEALRLAATGEPFNLTFLTVDQHHIGGYVCPVCGNEYDEDLANVLSCGDRLLADFISWCRQQAFFEDTVIVITGDHVRMDTILVDGVPNEDRQVYNCFINTDTVPARDTHNRTFTTVDIFPTVLSAMGF